jgi:hypothetical protein
MKVAANSDIREHPESLAFFAELLAGKPTDHPCYLWAREVGARYPLGAEDAAQTVALLGAELYVGVAFVAPGTGRRIGQNRRPKSEHAAGIYGVWLDVDVNGTPDGKDGVKVGAAPDLKAAVQLASAILPPTLLVASGGGVHAWHLLPEPWLFNADGEQAADLVAGWQEAHRQLVAWRIDSTHDLARVLRIPGTFNTKGATATPVRLIRASGPRHTVTDLRAAVAHVQPSFRATSSNGSGPRAGELDQDVFDRLLANSRSFARTWEHTVAATQARPLSATSGAMPPKRRARR